MKDQTLNSFLETVKQSQVTYFKEKEKVIANIQSIKINKYFEYQEFQHVLQLCPRLKKLVLRQCIYCRQILRIVSEIQDIQNVDIFISSQLMSQGINLLSKLNKLKYLTLTGFQQQFIENQIQKDLLNLGLCQNLQYLKIKSKIQSKHHSYLSFSNLEFLLEFKHLKSFSCQSIYFGKFTLSKNLILVLNNLQQLHFEKCTIPQKSIKQIVKVAKSLKSFTFTDYFVKCKLNNLITKTLPSLQKLSITYSYQLNQQTIDQVISKHQTQLIELQIDGYVFDEIKFINMIRSLTKLKSISFQPNNFIEMGYINYQTYNVLVNSLMIKSLAQQNTILKTLKLNGCILQPTMFQTISKYLPHIQELQIKTVDTLISSVYLSKLKELKSFFGNISQTLKIKTLRNLKQLTQFQNNQFNSYIMKRQKRKSTRNIKLIDLKI